MRARGVIWGAALAAALLRFPGLFWPARPDEAGFTLVARAWHPQADSTFGTYWVDRPPILIGLFKLTDWIGGPFLIRAVAAAGCVVLVLAAAATARAVVLEVRGDGALRDGSATRAAVWTAVLTAALVGNMGFDSASAKGEILGIPLVMVAFLLALRSLQRRSLLAAFGSGLLSMLAVGLKQNMVAGLAFGGVLLLGSLVARRLPPRDFFRLSAAALLGAAVPVAGTVAWARWAGVDLSTVWYAVYGFRTDAARVISGYESASNTERAHDLFWLLVSSGIVLLVAWLLLNLRSLVREAPVLTAAVLATVALDTAGLVLGGSYWGAYAYVPIPGVVLCLALVLSLDPGAVRGRSWARVRGLVSRVLVGYAVLATALSAAHFVSVLPDARPDEAWTGQAIAAAAEPGDTLVVYGGRADIQFTSGLPSPYPYLWSLPMRTLDPDLAELRALLDGPDAPTWFVAWVPMSSWGGTAERVLTPALEAHYRLETEACGNHLVYVRTDAPRPALQIDCDRSVLAR